MVIVEPAQAVEKAKDLLGGHAAARRRGHGQDAPWADVADQGRAFAHLVRRQVGPGHGAALLFHDRHDGVRDGTIIKRRCAIAGDEFQSPGLGFVDDVVARFNATLSRETPPCFGQVRPHFRMVPPYLGHRFHGSDVGSVGSETITGGLDGRGHHRRAVKGAVVFEGV